MSDLTAEAVQTRIRQILKNAEARRRGKDISFDILESMMEELAHLGGREPTHAQVLLFKPSGKCYTDESWAIPAGAIGPHDMLRSPDFRRINGGPVLVPEQEPWGYPYLLLRS